MPNYNRVILAGHLTRDVELRYTPNGHAVCDIGLAVNNPHSKKEEVSYFDCTAWRKSAETLAEYLSKGDPVLIEGRLKQGRWTTNDGQKRSKVKVQIDNFQFLGGKDSSGSQRNDPDQSKPPADAEDVDEESIPF